jgi:hypothetical protein
MRATDKTTGDSRVERAAWQARRPGLPQRMVRDGIWLAVLTHILGDRRFEATVITRAIGAYALGSLIKNNQARPVRRATAWYRSLDGSMEPGKR